MPRMQFIRQVGVFRWAWRYGARQFTKRVLRRDNLMHLPNGSSIVLPRGSQSATEVYVTGANVDWGAEALFARFAEPERDFIDVGAHIGYYSAYLSPLVRRVYAFEPHPANYAPLQANARLAGNVEVVPMAVSSHGGTGQLHLRAGSSVSSLDRSGGETISVPLTTIDDFLSARPQADPALIKTDIEGHDLQALLGMRTTVARCRPLILTECDDRAALAELCKDWEYSIFAFTRDRVSLKTKFLEMSSAGALENFWCKMLFLVPPRLHPQFRRRAESG
ncbi:MAG: FkbM family methyltransferase [Rhizomicrobium sp.]